jgi:hypothetical protein
VAWSVVSILFGWTLFAYWWFEVIEKTDKVVFLRALAAVVIVVDIVLLATLIWIAHNRRLARRGKRGRSTPFRIPRYERDRVHRAIVLAGRDSLQRAPILVITATAKEKTYSTPGTD